jgi:hypothetical protein
MSKAAVQLTTEKFAVNTRTCMYEKVLSSRSLSAEACAIALRCSEAAFPGALEVRRSGPLAWQDPKCLLFQAPDFLQELLCNLAASQLIMCVYEKSA